MTDEILQSQESTDGQIPGKDALQDSINALLEGNMIAEPVNVPDPIVK